MFLNVNEIEKAVAEKKSGILSEEASILKDLHKKDEKMFVDVESEFSRILTPIGECDNIIKANIAHSQAGGEVDLKHVILHLYGEYLNIFTSMRDSLLEKISAIPPIRIKESDLATFVTGIDSPEPVYEFTNLSFLRNNISLNDQINMYTGIFRSAMEGYSSRDYELICRYNLMDYRNNVRQMVFMTDQVFATPEDFIKALYTFFRGDGISRIRHFSIEELMKMKESGIYAGNPIVVMFTKDINSIIFLLKRDLKDIHDKFVMKPTPESINAVDVTLARLAVVLETYAQVYAARVDAIYEYFMTVSMIMDECDRINNQGGEIEWN